MFHIYSGRNNYSYEGYGYETIQYKEEWGYGYGWGFGWDDGDGYGDGSGNGNGDGYGDGPGDGQGDGQGDGDIWGKGPLKISSYNVIR